VAADQNPSAGAGAWREVARVVELWRYPVKSMAGEPLDGVQVSWNGLAGDRRWAFVRAGQEGNGFPWLTIRERAELWRYRPWFTQPDRPDASATMVRTPSGEEFDVVDPKLADELGAGTRVIRQKRGIFDIMPLSLTSTQTVGSLSALVGAELSALRFRPNLVVEALDVTQFPEDAWVGSVLQIGGLRMRVDQQDQRCVMINVDPETTSKNPDVLRAVTRERGACLGVYGSTVEPGYVAVGDRVFIELGAAGRRCQ
jgi:uncharacterized protein